MNDTRLFEHLMASSATLRDVAKLAGVSIGTASQALNNRPNVLPETRARVVEAAATLGYLPKEPTSNGAERPLAVAGMLTKHDYGLAIDVNPFFSHVQLGVESECRKHSLSLMYANIEVDRSNRPVMWPAMILEQRVDGLILIATFIQDALEWLQRQVNIPIVLVDSYAPGLSYDSVVIDNSQGATSAVNYLVDNGHRHIGLVGSNPASPPDILERRDAYVRALYTRGITDVYIEDSWLGRDSGHESATRLLSRAPQVTAIIACNDDVAIGVMGAVRDMGLSVPGNVSVVGFDDIDLAKEVQPALTTVHVHKSWLGRLAVQRLVERAKHPEQPRITITVATHLVVRESTGPYKGQ